MRVRLAGLLLVLAVGGGSGASAASAPEVTSGPAAAVTVCKSGYRHAIIGGRHMCLKAGQACKRSFDRTYHRYGFHCHTEARLSRTANAEQLERQRLSGGLLTVPSTRGRSELR